MDYFTKWVEVEAINTINSKAIVSFVFKKIVCQFGVPVQIVTNNKTQFTSKEMKKFCKNSEIKLCFARIYHPKMNGKVEAANKTIVRILERKVVKHPESWMDILPEVMWAYRTTIKTATGHTLLTLAVLVWPTARVLGYNEQHNEEVMIEDEDLWEQIRGEAALSEEKFKRSMERYYNSKVIPKKLVEGDLVLCNAQTTGTDREKGKLAPKWEGTYIIKEVLHPGTYTLVTHKGKRIKNALNIDNLCKFYH